MFYTYLIHIFEHLMCYTNLLLKCVQLNTELEMYSVERIYLRQRCFDASKPRVAASTGAQYK